MIKILEDTVRKSNGKWTNRGDDGTEHGEFDTKEEADSQRKAMFANGYHESVVHDNLELRLNEALLFSPDKELTYDEAVQYAKLKGDSGYFIDEWTEEDYDKFIDKYGSLTVSDMDDLIDSSN